METKVVATVTRAHGAKCQRCWQVTRCWVHECFTDRGPICGRCRQVVDGLVADGELAEDHPAVRPAPAEAPCEACEGRCVLRTAPVSA